MNPNQIKKTHNPRRSKPKRTQTKCGWREHRGGVQSASVWKRRSHLPVFLLAFRAAAPLSNCGWVDRQTDGWADGQTVPPLPCLPFSSSALWSWMELNANDLTELKSYKRNQFLFFCWFVLIVLSLLCLLMPFYVLYFSAYYLFGITYSLTYLRRELLIFFGSRARDFLSGGWKKKYCENLASRILLDNDCLGEGDKKKTQKAKNTKTVKPKTEQ